MARLELKRIVAFIIDVVGLGWILQMLLPNSWPLVVSLTVQIVLLGALNGELGFSPGKLLFGLRVRHRITKMPIGFSDGIMRECAKQLCLALYIGVFWGLRDLMMRKSVFYDAWLNAEVVDTGHTLRDLWK
ncbi:MAG: hypothetical protein GY822_31105 [Deltaproteobacteria bacterium]|nr:hypothetical protein [Deltaproteobacteria bacterium]